MEPYSGIDGFLGTRASIMLDVVFLAMFAVVPVLGWSVWLVKYRRNFTLHKRVQLALGLVLLVAVALFEADMRINGWKNRAEASAYFDTWVGKALSVHLVFAVTTALLWVFVIVQALRRFPNPPVPNEYSPRHLFWAKLAAVDMLLTAVTGWVFYCLAFVA
jgi:putative membrane protein